MDSTTDALQLKAVKAEQYTVKFDSQGGSTVSDQIITSGGNAEEPTPPMYDGYEFAGWYTDAACQTKYDFTSPVTGDITLYAKWNKNSGGAGGTTQTFSDISGHWAEEYIRRVAGLGWIKGFDDGTFRPDAYITRAQAMTMINRVLNRIPEDESDLLAGMNIWPDCNPGNWFYLAVQEATNSHAFQYKTGNYETWTGMNKNPRLDPV